MDLEELLPQADSLSRMFAAAFILAGVPGLLYARSMGKDVRLGLVSVGFIAAALGVVLTRNFLWFLVFWELTVLVSCYLILWERKPADFTVAYRYFLIHVFGGTSLFFAVALQVAASGSFEMDGVVPEAMPFFLVAFLTKAAVFPLHVWVPLTYPSVPPAVAVVLSAYPTKIGVYAFARVLPGLPWIAYAGACMAMFGVGMALKQKTARRLLSYHLLSQVGYMITGIGLGTELGIHGATLHMMNNVVYKTLLFMVAGVVLYRRGTEVMTRVGGVGKCMPLTFAAALVGAAAISGLPPLSGYVSKTLLKAATEGHTFLQWALLLAGIGTAFSFTKFIWLLFLQKGSAEVSSDRTIREAPFGACVAMGVLALLCLAQGVFYPHSYAMIGTTVPYAVFNGNQVLAGTVLVLAGVALYMLASGAAKPVVSPMLVRTFRSLALAVRREGVASYHSAATAPPDADPLRDANLVYAWLLYRILQMSRNVALRVKDETQMYLLLITALLVALVAYLVW